MMIIMSKRWDYYYGGIVDEPYNISGGYQPEEYSNNDYFPLRNKPIIKVNNSNQ